MPKDTSVSDQESQQELEQLRHIILGQDNQRITDAVNKDARSIVSNVLTEAFHDRQKKDDSIKKVLLPIVENSVEHSVTHHSDRLISSLYPLMGSLVRKSVGAFLSNFIERTNQLIEHSFTIKGLTWRFKAWQAGVSFTQYVVSQTYNYRVEHIFLIHQETGLLLKAVNLDQQSQNDAELISSMLTAINDFVGDSFQLDDNGVKEQLQTVSTDNFNLLIKPGPSAIIVAAVSGTPPQSLNEQLQLTLEEVHHLYQQEFQQFNGDNAPFENVDTQLNDCLLTEEKPEQTSNRRKPWFAWFIMAISILFIGFKSLNWYKLDKLHQQIIAIDHEAGIVVKNLEVHSKQLISLDLMRDPSALSVQKWFELQKIPFENVTLKERRYYSLSPELIKIRIEEVLQKYPQITFDWQNDQLNLYGQLDYTNHQQLTSKLVEIGLKPNELNEKELTLTNSRPLAESVSINQQVFKALVGKIASIQLSFDSGDAQVNASMTDDLQLLKQQVTQLSLLASQLNKSVGLIIMGCSDNTGNVITNNALSLKRAENTALALTKLGLKREQMYVTGIGQINIKDVKNTARKVMFNIIYVEHTTN
ncbi:MULTISPECIES: OmpA family protein [Thalassotalea]|uniref:OmpA family protein n=1 Tax=Thalassotalea castellviae TaxID=3075612 RepID=A0ABU3A038_9GAMM|nr:OmpA family protein [Thalassotalea sp. W431]MDT0603546.1 OmpA family protein [Thalassotalea sp. W431]